MKKPMTALIAASLLMPAAPALAIDTPWTGSSAYAPRHSDVRSFHDDDDHGRYDRYGRYREPRRLSRNDRVWRGRDGRYHCRRGNGTTGLIIGGAVGALVGREVDGGRDRTVGTILGAAGGALLGREIDRGGLRCR